MVDFWIDGVTGIGYLVYATGFIDRTAALAGGRTAEYDLNGRLLRCRIPDAKNGVNLASLPQHDDCWNVCNDDGVGLTN